MKANAPGPIASLAKGLTRRRLFGVAGGLTLSAAATTAYGAGVEAQSLIVTRYAPRPPRWPSGLDLKIAVIADLHAGGPNMGLAHVRRAVDLTNELKPDLTLLLGDYFATHRFVTERVSPPQWAGELERLNAPLGVYAILGNHDWWHDIDGTRKALAAVRIPVLENGAVKLDKNGRGFWLAGLGDQLAYRLGHGHFRGVDDLPATLARVNDDDPVLLMAHEPDIFVRIPDRVALTLAGHTHGGQIRIPLIWEHTVPSSYGTRFAYGHIVENARHMIVSGGLGTSIVPVRVGVPPEIVLVTLGA